MRHVASPSPRAAPRPRPTPPTPTLNPSSALGPRATTGAREASRVRDDAGAAAAMLAAHAARLRALDVVLASGSPRRRELLSGLLGEGGFRVAVSGFAEDLAHAAYATPEAYCLATAEAKARDVLRAEGAGEGADLVIGADTVVVHPDGRTVLEKPADAADAAAMLRALAGRDHWVYTGVVLLARARATAPATADPDPACVRFGRRTRVRFAALDEATVAAYVATEEPYDKAGGYGIQGQAGAFVEEIEGCYFNVVGLPVHLLATTLLAMLRDGTLPNGPSPPHTTPSSVPTPTTPRARSTGDD